MKTFGKTSLKFPCDCISSTTVCEEPWVRVAKEGMFKNGTKEGILNQLHEKPMTIAQLAKLAKLAQPTVLRHLYDLVNNGLVKECDPNEKDYVVERYYKPNFPVVTQKDQKLYNDAINEISREVAKLAGKRLSQLEERFKETNASQDGWQFKEFAQYLFHSISRNARQLLKKKGLLADRLEKAGIDFIFWAQEVK